MMTSAPVDEPLSAGNLARLLGVATTTLRTWHQRYGLGPSEHQQGRHRRYTARDVARLMVMAQLTTRGVPAAEAARRARRESTVEIPCHPGTDAESRGLARAARRMDVLVLRETLAAAVTRHGVVHTWDTVATAAFRHLGAARCPEARRAVARRLLTRTLNEVFAVVPRPPAGTPITVLLAAVEPGPDVAALDALAAALAERGTAAAHLGAGLSPDEINAAVSRVRPAAVVIWSDTSGPVPPELLTACSGEPGWCPAVIEAGSGRACATLAGALRLVLG